jgi:hypothetical protein
VDYVQGAAGPDWVHRAGWDSASATDIGNLSFSYAPSSFDSQTFLLTYVWDDVTRTKSLYRDGVLVTSAVLGTDYPVHSPSSERVQVGGHLDFPGSYQYYGKISDLNIWDVALTSDEVATLASLQGRTPDQRTNIDPYAANVVSLLHFNGTDGSTTFTDVLGKTWTANGNAQIDTAQSKFGGASGLFDGSADYIRTADSNDFSFGAGDFTIEAFVRRANTSTTKTLVGKWDGGSQREWIIYVGGPWLQFSFSLNGSSDIVAFLTTSGLVATTWHHVAVVRNGTTIKGYIDGVEVGSYAIGTSSLYSGTRPVEVGYVSSDSYGPMDGHIDDLRITKGVARYTANFTPPSAAFPNP